VKIFYLAMVPKLIFIPNLDFFNSTI